MRKVAVDFLKQQSPKQRLTNKKIKENILDKLKEEYKLPCILRDQCRNQRNQVAF